MLRTQSADDVEDHSTVQQLHPITVTLGLLDSAPKFKPFSDSIGANDRGELTALPHVSPTIVDMIAASYENASTSVPDTS